MEYDAHLDAVRRETQALVATFATTPMDLSVPTCPDWTLRDLVEHVGSFTGFWAHVLCEGTRRDKPPFGAAPDDAHVAEWYAGVADSLLGLLGATDPDTEVWTWVPDQQHARFIGRRCANELAIHRFDAQSVTGSMDPIEARLAADGIDESFVMARAWANPPDGSGSVLHVHGTDHGDEWLITMTPDGLDVRHEHGPGDLTLSGTVSDLELLLYDRPTLGQVDRTGDPAVLAAWYREFHFG